MDGKPEITEDRLLGGAVRLVQPRRGHRAGTDAVLLAAAAAAMSARKVIDVGAASGAVGLMLARAMPAAEIAFIEQDPLLAALCRDNIESNGLRGRARAVAADIFDAAMLAREGISAVTADLVVSNPPFIEEGQARLSPDAARCRAHSLPKNGLARWISCCARLVKAKGTLALIHRADKLPECLAALPVDFGACRIRAIHPHQGEAAVRIIILALRGRKSPAVIEPPLFLHEADGAFTAEASAIHDGNWLPCRREGERDENRPSENR